MSTTAFRRRAHLLSASAAVALLGLTGCGGDGSDVPAAPGPSAGAGLADLTGGSLYDAITYARENDLSYTVEDASGDPVEVEDTRKHTVVEQDPSSGAEIRPRDSLTLVIEPAE